MYSSQQDWTISENDKKKFLKYLMNARNFGKNGDFENIIHNHVIKKLIDERMSVYDDIENLEELGKLS